MGLFSHLSERFRRGISDILSSLLSLENQKVNCKKLFIGIAAEDERDRSRISTRALSRVELSPYLASDEKKPH